MFAAGDIAAVPDLSLARAVLRAERAARGPAGQGAGPQHRRFGRGGQLKPYRHAYLGSVAGLGHHQGVAQVYRIRLTGLAGWLAHRAYHLFWVPTLANKARVLADWTLALFFRRETAQLTSLEHPADDFRDAVLPVPEDPVEVTEALSPGLPGGPMKPPGGSLERPGAGTAHQRHRARRQRRRRNEGISR